MLIDGKTIAKSLYEQISFGVAQLSFCPAFCDVLVGDDKASAQYVAMKARVAKSLGMKFIQLDVPVGLGVRELVKRIEQVALEPDLCGLIVQLPLPTGYDTQNILDTVPPGLDVDGLTTLGSAAFFGGQVEAFVPPTAGAILEILRSVYANIQDKDCVVIGQGKLVGRPVTELLQRAGANVRVINTQTKDPGLVASQADVLISAVGRPGLVRGEWVKPGALVIDAGTAEDSGAILGDVDMDTVGQVAGFVTPTPGGVGPVTVAKLFENVLRVAQGKAGRG